MIYIDRNTGRKYNLVKVFASTESHATHMEASTGRRYNLVKRYI